MKKTKITYLITTGLTSLMFVASSFMYLSQNPELQANLAKLGYPPYILGILGTAKLLGAIALWLPKFPRLKEWAYAGLVFNLLGAVWSHVAVADYAGGLFVLVPLALVLVSYFTYHRLPGTQETFASSLKPALS